MIQPLRSVHRRVFIGLVVVLPAILLVGLEARRPLPSVHTPVIPTSAYLMKKSDGLWQKHAIQTRFYGDHNHPQDISVVLTPVQDLGEPDLLLYWSAGDAQGNALPTGARLLGAFSPNQPLALPQSSGGAASGGHLILYSLAHQSAVDSAVLENLP